MKELKREQLAQLKPGDEVAIPSKTYINDEGPIVYVVTRRTDKTVWATRGDREIKFRTSDGRVENKPYVRVCEVTDEVRAQVAHAKNRSVVRDLVYKLDRCQCLRADHNRDLVSRLVVALEPLAFQIDQEFKKVR